MVVAPLTVAFILLVTVNVNVAVLEQLPDVARIEYVLVAVGETEMVPVLAPVFHTYELPPDAVSVVGLPGQIVVLPEIDAVMPFETVTVTLAVSAQPPLPTKTE